MPDILSRNSVLSKLNYKEVQEYSQTLPINVSFALSYYYSCDKNCNEVSDNSITYNNIEFLSLAIILVTAYFLTLAVILEFDQDYYNNILIVRIVKV